jgi:hypothetical protein
LDDIKVRRKPLTYRGYRQRLTRSLQILGATIRVGELRKYHLAAIERILVPTHSPTTVRDVIAAVQAVFSWAVRSDLLLKNPLASYKKTKPANADPPASNPFAGCSLANASTGIANEQPPFIAVVVLPGPSESCALLQRRRLRANHGKKCVFWAVRKVVVLIFEGLALGIDHPAPIRPRSSTMPAYRAV